jgi:hypothetical protein
VQNPFTNQSLIWALYMCHACKNSILLWVAPNLSIALTPDVALQ